MSPDHLFLKIFLFPTASVLLPSHPAKRQARTQHGPCWLAQSPYLQELAVSEALANTCKTHTMKIQVQIPRGWNAFFPSPYQPDN